MKPTIYDVAKEAGVSIATVSKVLNSNGRISDKTRRKVNQVMERLNYQPSMVASALTSRKTGTVGLMIPDIANPYFAEVARSFEDNAQKLGCDIIICSTDRDDDRAERYMSLLLRKRVDGLIIASHTGSPELIRRMLSDRVPLVLFSADIRSLESNSVSIDDYKGGYLATEYLLSLGHRNLGIISDNLPGSELRVQGFMEALEAGGISFDNPDNLIRTSATLENGRTAAVRMLSQTAGKRPTAIFACNDLLAIGVLKEARQFGLSIPRDLSVIGFDNTLLAEICHPSLSSISQPVHEMARQAMQLLNEEIEQEGAPKRKVLLMPELVVRHSTGPAPAAGV
ncbi:LacI family DNA-binding transcriptional regulator [Paenibacillus albidus]|uniref:LacI family DNA-binding transcriptional regulator n=1 Tax=Paenibacillus albidus TaxID=2041023 RepID=UPI001BE7CA11|nr:LacI family DNA-binding transcriptional regulator [Paenibacillus albidus]MBT2290387.1 LacI family DNA-binding transcriptional regulator [Paenibacillus albidus]